MPIRIVTTHLEFEGHTWEQRVVLEGEEPPVWGPEARLSVVGRPTPRVDGRERVTGSALYTCDVMLPGMLVAVGLGSPYPHARLLSCDPSRSEVLPGVRGIFHRASAADTALFSQELLYQGDLVAVAVAETEDEARDAVGELVVEYEPLPFEVDVEAALQPGAQPVSTEYQNNVIPGEFPQVYQRGDTAYGLAQSDVVIQTEFRTPTALHNSMETHGGVADWDGHTLTVWSSTQDVFGVRQSVARTLGLQQNQVRAIKHYMGGGFGSKLSTHRSTLLAAWIAFQLGRPVRYMLDREDENLSTGNRPETIQRYRIGATVDGTLVAIEQHSIANVGAAGDWFPPVAMATKELYQCPHVRTEDVGVRTNLGTQSAFRAPGAVEGTAGLEVALDALASTLGMDSLELRRKNFAERHQALDRPYARKLLLEAYRLGAERIGWSERDDPARRFPLGPDGYRRRGVGMASQLWGGDGGPPAQAIARLLPDGTAVILTGTQDIGTGTRTVLAQIAAEELGLALDQVRVELGDTAYGVFSPPSGGSMTLASVGPAVRMAAAEARKQLVEVIAQLSEAPVDAFEIHGGTVIGRETGKEMGTVSSYLDMLGGYEITARGMRGPNAENMTVRTFGVQFAEVEVDIGTGRVRVLRVVAVHDCGRVINPLSLSSQIEGGIIQGIGLALMEQRIVDPRLGVVLNPNLETYQIPTIADIPEIDIIMLDEPNIHANSLGSLGAGEPPIIPTPGAVANAVGNAIGRPVDALPLTPDRVLGLLRGHSAP